jgi:hypothetical protein
MQEVAEECRKLRKEELHIMYSLQNKLRIISVT